MKLLEFDKGKGLFIRLVLGWKRPLLVLNWNNGIFPGDWFFSFLKDWGSVNIWKLLTCIEGVNHDESCFSSLENGKSDSRSNWLGPHKARDDCDFSIFPASFNMFSRFETPRSNGELGLLLVPTFLVWHCENCLVKSSLNDLLVFSTSQNQLNDKTYGMYASASSPAMVPKMLVPEIVPDYKMNKPTQSLKWNKVKLSFCIAFGLKFS